MNGKAHIKFISGGDAFIPSIQSIGIVLRFFMFMIIQRGEKK